MHAWRSDMEQKGSMSTLTPTIVAHLHGKEFCVVVLRISVSRPTKAGRRCISSFDREPPQRVGLDLRVSTSGSTWDSWQEATLSR